MYNNILYILSRNDFMNDWNLLFGKDISKYLKEGDAMSVEDITAYIYL